MTVKKPSFFPAVQSWPLARLFLKLYLTGWVCLMLSACQPANLVESASQTGSNWFFILLAAALAAGFVYWIMSARLDRQKQVVRSQAVEIQEVKNTLRQLQEQCQALSESIPFPIVITHAQTGKLLFFNQRFVNAFGVDRAHAGEQVIYEFFADPRAYEDLIQQLAKQGDIHTAPVEMWANGRESFLVEMVVSQVTYDRNPALFVLVMDVSKRKELENRLENLAITDNLTGLYNRHYFFQKGLEEIKRIQRYPQPLSLLYISIDTLSEINRTQGQTAGDQVLKEISLMLLSSLRDVDIIGRVRSQEFGILIPNTDLQAAALIAERLRQKMTTKPVNAGGVSISITVSIGVSYFHDPYQTFDDLLGAAEEAVHHARASDRSRVFIAGQGSPIP